MSIVDANNIAAIASAGSAIVSIGALSVAVAGYKVSNRSTRAAEALSRIERRREWSDLRPEFEVTLNERDDRATLRVHFAGPLGLDKLDRIEISLRDDFARQVIAAGGPIQEEIDAYVWGPYRFKAGLQGADSSGRSVAPFSLALGEERVFTLVPQQQPPWNHGPQEVWRKEYTGKPLRLKFVSAAEGFDPWVTPHEVPRLSNLNVQVNYGVATNTFGTQSMHTDEALAALRARLDALKASGPNLGDKVLDRDREDPSSPEDEKEYLPHSPK